jgi:hypothetical protein
MDGHGRPWVARVLAAVSTVMAVLAAAAAVDTAAACLAVGAHVDDDAGGHPGGELDSFRAADELFGPLTVRRTFDPVLPADFRRSAAAADPEAGLVSFVSWKPPDGDIAGAIRGDYDERVTAWARSAPSTGVWATAYHEPENDMTADQFVALHRRLHRVVKEANPGIRWGPVYMAHWWDPGATEHYVGDPASWWPGDDRADFSGVDWYGADPEPMTTNPEFLHWYEHMRSTGKPLVVAEYGQYVVAPGSPSDPALERRRAEAIRADAAWLETHPEFRMWLYWHDLGHGGDWRLTDEASMRAWRDVAASGCRS